MVRDGRTVVVMGDWTSQPLIHRRTRASARNKMPVGIILVRKQDAFFQGRSRKQSGLPGTGWHLRPGGRAGSREEGNPCVEVIDPLANQVLEP